ncbi:MAG: sugar transferase [Bacteroidetes bacterium]|nr:sugar transferase [Bacteroidota bacterium]
MRKFIFGFFTNSLLIAVCYYFFNWLKWGTLILPLSINLTFVLFFFVWLVVALLTKKYVITNKELKIEILSTIALSDLIELIVFGILIKYLRHFENIRFVILYTLLLTSIVELILGYSFAYFKKTTVRQPFYEEHANGFTAKSPVVEPPVYKRKKSPVPDEFYHYPGPIDLHQIIIEETNENTFNFVKDYFTNPHDTLVLSTTTVFNIYNQPREKFKVIINLKRINDIQYINKFFEAINTKLDNTGIFIDWVETYSLKKKRILAEYVVGLNYLVYAFDVIFHRIFPKLPVTKKIYFFLTKGRNRVLSKAETFGRLYSCGFEIIEDLFIDNRLFFVVRKIKEPAFDKNPTYGPLIRLKRIGKNGKIIGVYKLRTMHAYSEYLQGYIHTKNDLQEGGKFKNDFRITTLGRIFRKLWIDELPMLINLIKGDLKFVGVRPLSQHYFNLYSEELQERRLKYKPGLIPPFYADLPKTLDEIMKSEIRYLDSYDKSPIFTDISYFFKAWYNIIFKRARSN